MSKKLKLSPWREMDEPPTEIGLYELLQPEGEDFVWSWWDGRFRGAWPSKIQAVDYRYFSTKGCSNSATAWRGVLK